MAKKRKLDYDAVEAFKAELVTVCLKHGMSLEYYHHQYDEYDSDEGFQVIPITGDWDLFEIKSAMEKS